MDSIHQFAARGGFCAERFRDAAVRVRNADQYHCMSGRSAI